MGVLTAAKRAATAAVVFPLLRPRANQNDASTSSRCPRLPPLQASHPNTPQDSRLDHSLARAAMCSCVPLGAREMLRWCSQTFCLPSLPWSAPTTQGPSVGLPRAKLRRAIQHSRSALSSGCTAVAAAVAAISADSMGRVGEQLRCGCRMIPRPHWQGRTHPDTDESRSEVGGAAGSTSPQCRVCWQSSGRRWTQHRLGMSARTSEPAKSMPSRSRGHHDGRDSEHVTGSAGSVRNFEPGEQGRHSARGCNWQRRAKC